MAPPAIDVGSQLHEGLAYFHVAFPACEVQRGLAPGVHPVHARSTSLHKNPAELRMPLDACYVEQRGSPASCLVHVVTFRDELQRLGCVTPLRTVEETCDLAPLCYWFTHGAARDAGRRRGAAVCLSCYGGIPGPPYCDI